MSRFGLLTFTQAMSDEGWAIETQAAQCESARCRQGIKCSIIKLEKML